METLVKRLETAVGSKCSRPEQRLIHMDSIHFLIRKPLQGNYLIISFNGQIWKHWSGNCLIRKSDQIRKVSQEEAGGSLVVDGVWQFVLWEPYSSVQWGPTLSVLHRLPC